MDSVSLIWRGVLLWALALLSGGAFAYGVVLVESQTGTLYTTRLVYGALGSGSASASGSSRAAACSAAFTAAGGYPTTVYGSWMAGDSTRTNYAPEVSSNNCVVKFDDCVPASYGGAQVCTRKTAESAGFNESTTTQSMCPNNSVPKEGSTSECVCSLGFEKGAGNTCTATDCAAVVVGLAGAELTYSGQGATTCYKGCTVQASLRGYLSATNTTTTEGPILPASPSKCTGDSVTGSTSTKVEANKVCVAGECHGTVNGADVCVACSSTAVPPVSKAASGVSPDAGVPDGGKITTETKCADGKCVTSEKVFSSGGQLVGQRDTEESQDSFCEENPLLAICKKSSFSGAVCGVAPACEGDAVQCAIAIEVYKQGCEMRPTQGVLDAGTELYGDSGPHPEGHPLLTPTEVNIDQMLTEPANPLGASCPSDFTVGGVVVPLSKTCDPLIWLGRILLAVTYLAGAGWLAKGIS